jgi:NAD(P)-dependent dehydrogenase (short-subunit alcohol dehydrogenase family)
MTDSYSSLSPAAHGAGSALVVGANGGLGAALAQTLRRQKRYAQVLAISRTSEPAIDYAQEASLAQAAQWVGAQCADAPLRLVIVATGMLHINGAGPEKSLANIDAAYLQSVFAINAVGPALLLKHFAPLLPKQGDVRVVMLSAKVGSMGDNALGGWIGYRASKAALNQIVKTASIELSRRNKASICVAMHPGTVDTALSKPFGKTGLNVRAPAMAAGEILGVIHGLTALDTGSFVDYLGAKLPW